MNLGIFMPTTGLPVNGATIGAPLVLVMIMTCWLLICGATDWGFEATTTFVSLAFGFSGLAVSGGFGWLSVRWPIN